MDGSDDVRISMEVFPVILPEVPRGQQQASMLGEEVPELPEAWQQVGHLQAYLLQAPGPGAVRETGQGTCCVCQHRIGPLHLRGLLRHQAPRCLVSQRA